MAGWGWICPSWGRKPKGDLSSAVWGRSKVFSLASPMPGTSDARETLLASCRVSLSFRWSPSPNVSRGWASLRGQGLVPAFPRWCWSPLPRQHPDAPTALVLASTWGAQRGDQSRQAGVLHAEMKAWDALTSPCKAQGCPAPGREPSGPRRDLLVAALSWGWVLFFLRRSRSPSDKLGSAQPGTSVGRTVKQQLWAFWWFYFPPLQTWVCVSLDRSGGCRGDVCPGMGWGGFVSPVPNYGWKSPDQSLWVATKTQ